MIVMMDSMIVWGENSRGERESARGLFKRMVWWGDLGLGNDVECLG